MAKRPHKSVARGSAPQNPRTPGDNLREAALFMLLDYNVRHNYGRAALDNDDTREPHRFTGMLVLLYVTELRGMYLDHTQLQKGLSLPNRIASRGLIDAAVERGLITIDTESTARLDQRSSLIVLTDVGRSLIERLAASMHARLEWMGLRRERRHRDARATLIQAFGTNLAGVAYDGPEESFLFECIPQLSEFAGLADLIPPPATEARLGAGADELFLHHDALTAFRSARALELQSPAARARSAAQSSPAEIAPPNHQTSSSRRPRKAPSPPSLELEALWRAEFFARRSIELWTQSRIPVPSFLVRAHTRYRRLLIRRGIADPGPAIAVDNSTPRDGTYASHVSDRSSPLRRPSAPLDDPLNDEWGPGGWSPDDLDDPDEGSGSVS